MVGLYLAGLIMDNFNPNLLWYFCAVIGMITTLLFLMLHWRVHPKTVPV